MLTVTAYPPDAILGPTLFSIPAEELFFFVIQTYIVCALQIARAPFSLATDNLAPDLAE
jgi:hypothetical protein